MTDAAIIDALEMQQKSERFIRSFRTSRLAGLDKLGRPSTTRSPRANATQDDRIYSPPLQRSAAP